MASDLRVRDERAKQIADAWKTVVGVQMHFNDIGMRIRGLFVTILLALFASIGFLLDKQLSLTIGRVNIQFATIVPIFGIFVAMLFYFMDRYWFHRLLKGSVNHAIEIERRYRGRLPELSLSDQIGKESFFAPTGVIWLAAKIFVRHERFKKDGLLHSDGKLELFYKPMMCVLAITAILLAVLGGVSLDAKQDKERIEKRSVNSQPAPSSVGAPTTSPTNIPSPTASPLPVAPTPTTKPTATTTSAPPSSPHVPTPVPSPNSDQKSSPEPSPPEARSSSSASPTK